MKFAGSCGEFSMKLFMFLVFGAMATSRAKQTRAAQNTPTGNYYVMDFEKHFHLSVFGQLESIFLPLGCDSKAVYCRYEILAGPDWELVSGTKTGVTQTCMASRYRFQEISLNMPLEFTYKSTNPFGCEFYFSIKIERLCYHKKSLIFVGPQIVVSFWGTNFWGTEVCRGYARLHIPLPERDNHRHIEAPIVSPKPMDLWSKVVGWISDWVPELRDPSVLAHGNRTKGIHTESYGHLRASFDVLTRGSEALHLELRCH